MCDEITYVMNIASTKVTSIISANVTGTMLKNSDDKKVRYKMEYFILHRILLVTILLFIVTIICYHYAKHSSKQKSSDALTK